MGVLSIACYRPKPGKEGDLEQLTREHVAILRDQRLVTDRKPILGRAKDGTIVEVFEWRSQEAIDSAHGNAEVLKLWGRYSEACDYVKLADVAESRDLFASLEPID